MNEECRKALRDLMDHGVPQREAVELMKLEMLARIADTLEGIQSELCDLNASVDDMDQNFNNCIGRTSYGGVIRIAGNVTGY